MRAIRLHQLSKNVILLVPAIAGHKLTDEPTMLHTLMGIVAFSLCACCVYIVNDILDVESDRAHPTKKRRPFASGELKQSHGLIVAALLLGASLGVSMWLPTAFIFYLGIYFFTTLLYSVYLKRQVLLDVFVLAALYLLRILAGHGATGIAYSSWLLGFSMFLFLSLAMLKRYIELFRAKIAGRLSAQGRGYMTADLGILISIGPISGWMAALVLSLYINSPEVQLLYKHPLLLLLACPLLLYWISRAWLLARRDLMHEDPVVFALKDPGSYAVGAATAFVMWMATI